MVQKINSLNYSLIEQTEAEKSVIDKLDKIKEVENCIDVCPCCGQSLKGGNHVFSVSN